MIKNKKDYKERIIKFVIIITIVFILTIILLSLLLKPKKNFEYMGVKFTIVDFCSPDKSSCLRTYQTKVPVIYMGKKANYSFYLHRDPHKTLKNVPFDGELVFKKEMAVHITFNRFCNGFEQVAVANFLTLHRVIGINITGEDKECDVSGNKMYVNIQESNRTFIEKIGPSCYNINIKDCEILEGMERFMIESFVKIK
ncbi:MAG: hypothetical protein QXU40_00710 [Candidatus Pacearchaeota archaeon]